MDILAIAGIDISHLRLVDLTRLADQAKPFYDWVEKQFQHTLMSSANLDQMLQSAESNDIQRCMRTCYLAALSQEVPLLFDGIGRSYSHKKACFYFFSWLIRDAPQQRLNPLILRIVKQTGENRIDAEVAVLSPLITEYRAHVKTFSWEAVREVIIDRLEGSRRSLKGHENEVVIRSAILTAVQTYFDSNEDYGIYHAVEITDGQRIIGGESYDAIVNLVSQDKLRTCRILVMIKTRETEGGEHAHLFTRDITAAIRSARTANPEDYLIGVIVANNWSQRETENLNRMIDHLIVVENSSGAFKNFDTETQIGLNSFISSVLRGELSPKVL